MIGLLLVVSEGFTFTQPAVATGSSGPLSGAIFTTTENGDVVNENVRYEAKEDVYLDGGPGEQAPSRAAALPAGEYFFQVTDPSGQVLLSTDHISCRKVGVNDNGVIDTVFSGVNYEKSKGNWVATPCQHNSGIDIYDHDELGAITVQLYPYDDTPNPGGVYKVWITPVIDYQGDPNFVPTKMSDPVNGEDYSPGNFHGFIPHHSKTDNYKVDKKGKPFTPPMITVDKFHDANFNGVQDEGEETVSGWTVDYTDPLDVSNTIFTSAMVDASVPGTYTFTEDQPAGTYQTASFVDGVATATVTATVDVFVAGESGETHTVLYGNVGLGDVTACKVYDADADGIVDASESGVVGWKMRLNGTLLDGTLFGPVDQFTGGDGCTTFGDLLPGDYRLEEIFPEDQGWTTTGATYSEFTIVSTLSGAVMSGTSVSVSFTNVYIGTADFGTKGYWHNKNGLSELVLDDVLYVNSLLPYSAASSYFGAGDEPFDGYFADGTPVGAAFNNDDGSEIWGSGTWQAEVSNYLIDPNAGGDPREQLGQQLLAFIFNTIHRLGGTDVYFWDGIAWVNAGDIIQAAIDAWASGDSAAQVETAQMLDGFNNDDSIQFIGAPGPVIYT